MVEPVGGNIDPNSVVRLRDDVERVLLNEDELVLASDLVSLRLRGASVDVFNRVLAQLDGTRSVADIMDGWAEQAVADGVSLLDQLLAADVLAFADGGHVADPYLSMLASLGIGQEGFKRLAALRVGIVGTEGAGAHAAALLAQSRIGTLVLVDPYPCSTNDARLWPPGIAADAVAAGMPRQSVIGELVAQAGANVERPLASAFERNELFDALEGCDLVVHAFDKGFAASAMWVNEYSLRAQRPAIYAQVRGHLGFAGPLMFPGEGPCYLCARMRAIACADDFEVAMGLEESLDRQRRPRLADRPTLPHVSAQLGALIAADVLKASLAIGTPALAAKIAVLDGLAATQELHPVIQHPDCPACRKKDLPPRRPPSEWIGRPVARGLPAAGADLVSDRTGVIRSLTVVPKDQFEPALPIVIRAELSNHRFVGADAEPFEVCSGKGMSIELARVSALGEACERYAGATAGRRRLVRASRATLGAPSLAPPELVLYAQHQYDQLPYHPWNESAEIDWIDALDLDAGAEVFVPAIAALMHYTAPAHDGYLFPVTSNGLAGGPTPEGATLAAAYEVIERDAFMISWMQRVGPRVAIDPATVPDEHVRHLAEAYRRRRIALELYVLETDAAVPVVAALGIDRSGDGPAAVVGLGCDADAAVACRQAALEVGQVRPALKARLRDVSTRTRLAELLADHACVEALEDHDLLFADPSMLSHLDIWRTAATEPYPFEPAAACSDAARLEQLVDRLTGIGTTLIAVDLDAEDLVPFGLHTRRAIIPSFQPIHFGFAEARLGGTRLYELPRRLGMDAASDAAGVFSVPHPLS